MSKPPNQLRSLDTSTTAWNAIAVKWLDFPLGRFMDYGCGGGKLMKQVEAQSEEVHGVDVNDAAYLKTQKEYPNFHFSEIGMDGKTSYPDASFDTIAIIEVIEHVPDERATMQELDRILKPGGKLILTTPHRGLLTFLDIANFKFVFPRSHRFIHLIMMRNKKYYKRRFEETQNKNLVGDISVSADRDPWHRHYKLHEIESYGPDSLKLDKAIVFFPGLRLMSLVRQILRVICLGRFAPFPFPLTWIERRLRRIESNTGDQLAVMWVKEDATGEPRIDEAEASAPNS